MTFLFQKTIERLLLKLSRFLGTDIIYIMRGSFWLTLASGVGMLTGFLLSIAYANYVPKETYGNYRYVLSFISLAGIFALPGMGISIIRSVSRGFDGTFRRYSPIMFLSSFGMSAVLFTAGAWFFLQENIELAAGFFIASLVAPFAEGLGSWQAYLDGRKKFKDKAILTVTINIFYTLGMLALLVTVFKNSQPSIWHISILTGGYLLLHAIPHVIFFVQSWKQLSPSAPSENTALQHGIHLTLASVPATVATYIDSILLHAFLGPSTLAIYAFAIILPEQMKKLINNGLSTLFPKLAASREGNGTLNAEVRSSLLGKVLKASLVTALFVLAYIIVAPLIYKFFFPQYIESVPYSQIFALSIAFMPFSLFITAVSIEENRKTMYLQRTISPIIQIVLLLILIPLYGLWGAVAGKTIGRFTNYAIAYVFFRWRK